MPHYKQVSSLLDLALAGLETLLKNGALHCSDSLVSGSREEVVLGFRTRKMMEDLVTELSNWLFGHVAPCLHDKVTKHIISVAECHLYNTHFNLSTPFQSLEKAVDIKKKTSTTNREMVILVSLVEIIINDRLSFLDVSDIAKILRTNIFDKLNKFVGLKTLILGSGTGGWSNMYVEKFASGVKTMKHLVKFSLCYDCTDLIVKILIRNCKKTLRILDVEMSKQVTDEAADWIAQAENIHTLQIYHSGITELGHAKLLLKLRRLKVLVRGGFLCEALEELSQSVKLPPKLEIEEFWSSEDYFFHDEAQMALVHQMCPKMRKMMFQFSKEVMTDVLFLVNFDNLSELHLWVSWQQILAHASLKGIARVENFILTKSI